MAVLKQRQNFSDSEEGKAVRHTLQLMESDSRYNTASTYHPNAIRYADNLMPFVDKHMDYLSSHPQVDVWTYISNVKLMTRFR